MNTLKKNYILSNKGNKEMALLTIENQTKGQIATLKTYHMPDQAVTLCLGNQNQTVFSQALNIVNGSCQFVVSANTNQPLACVLGKEDGNQFVPLLWDTASENGYKQFVVQTLTANLTTKQVAMKQQVPNPKPKLAETKLDLDALFELEDGQALDQLIDQNLKTSTNTFMTHDTDKLKEKLQEGQIFYDLVSGQIQDLFQKYPAQTQLEQLIPNSKWVTVDYEGGKPYVLGLIYDDITLKYICYGVPGEFEQTPPKEVEAFSQWLPLNPSNLSDGGYWVMYQDALTGDNIQVEFV